MLRQVRFAYEGGTEAETGARHPIGTDGRTAAAELAAERVRDADWFIGRMKACLAGGAEITTTESEGVMANVDRWRDDVVWKSPKGLGSRGLCSKPRIPWC